jgi:myosin heavy subunit
MEGCDDAMRKNLGLAQADAYFYLNQSATLKADGIDDFQDYLALMVRPLLLRPHISV